ncbi:MAG: hypothetical protein QOI95_3525 [Acidimicrobiaceae bacterium]|jgi:PST family polysaccharide transporter
MARRTKSSIETSEPAPRSLANLTGRGAVVNLVFGGVVDALAAIQGILVPRLLGPGNVGLFALASGGVAIGLSLKAVDLPKKVVQERDVDLHTAYGVAFTMEIMLAGFFTLVVLGIAPIIAHLYDKPELWLLTSVLAATVFSTAFLELPAAIPYREMKFFRRNVLTAVGPVVSFAVTIPAAYLGAGVWSLVAGTLAGFAASALVLLFASPIRPKLTWDGVVMRRFLSFGWPVWVSGLCGLLGGWGSVFAVSAAVGVAGLGFFDLAQNWAMRALQINGVLSDAVFPALCSMQSSVARLRRAFIAITRLGMLWAGPVGFALLLFSKPAIDILLGPSWQPALILMQAEAAGIIFNSVGQSWNLFYAARGQTKPWLVNSVLGLVWTFVVVVPLVLLFGTNGAAMSIVVLALGSYALRQYFVRKIFGPMFLLGLAWRELLVGGIAAGATSLVRLAGWEVRSLGGFVAQGLLYLVFAAAATLVLCRSLLTDLFSAVRARPSVAVATADAQGAPDDGPAWRRMVTPRAMAFPLLAAADPDGTTLWVTTRDWPALGRLDVVTGQWRWTELPPFPHAPSPDGFGGCWTALTRSSALAHVSASGDVQTVPLTRSRELLVTAVAGEHVWVVDAHRKVLVRVHATSHDAIEVALPDSFIRADFVVLGPSDEIWVADTQSAHIALVTDATSPSPQLRVIDAPHPTRAIVADPDRGGVWLGASTKSQLSLLDSTGTVLATVELPAVPFGLCRLHDGRLATAFKDGDSLCIVDAERGTTLAVPLPAGSMPMGCAAIGQRLFVTLGAASEIVEIPLAALVET